MKWTYNGEPAHQLTSSKPMVTIPNIDREIPAPCNDRICFHLAGGRQVRFIGIENKRKRRSVVTWQLRLIEKMKVHNDIIISDNMENG